MDIVKRISVALVGFSSDELTKIVTDNPKSETPVMRVYGQIESMDADKGTYGAFIRFKGAFEAVDLKTGRKIRSGILLLPEVAQNVLASQFAGIQEINPDAKMEFAADIKVRASNSKNANSAKYAFTCENLMEPDSNDPLSKLGSRFEPPKLIGSPEVKTEEKPEESSTEKPAEKAKLKK